MGGSGNRLFQIVVHQFCWQSTKTNSFFLMSLSSLDMLLSVLDQRNDGKKVSTQLPRPKLWKNRRQPKKKKKKRKTSQLFFIWSRNSPHFVEHEGLLSVNKYQPLFTTLNRMDQFHAIPSHSIQYRIYTNVSFLHVSSPKPSILSYFYNNYYYYYIFLISNCNICLTIPISCWRLARDAAKPFFKQMPGPDMQSGSEELTSETGEGGIYCTEVFWSTWPTATCCCFFISIWKLVQHLANHVLGISEQIRTCFPTKSLFLFCPYEFFLMDY